MGPLGIPEMLFIFVVALIFFGPKKLPELGRTIGKGMAEFRRASNELKYTFQREMDNIERETRMDEARKAASDAGRALKQATTYDDYEDYPYDGDQDGVGKPGPAASASDESKPSDPSPSPGGSTDDGRTAAETSSSAGSNRGETAVASSDSAGTDQPVEKTTA